MTYNSSFDIAQIAARFVETVVAAVKAAKAEAEFAALSFLSFDIAGIL